MHLGCKLTYLAFNFINGFESQHSVFYRLAPYLSDFLVNPRHLKICIFLNTKKEKILCEKNYEIKKKKDQRVCK